VAQTLRETQHELNNARDRLRHLEDQLNTDHRSLTKTENQYRDKLNERNTLLLTVYQAIDKVAGSDKVRRCVTFPA
jgi:chromosome segregation ATPase